MSEEWRAQFPIFNSSDIAYLDTASSAQKPYQVIDTQKKLYETQYANIHRGLYDFSQATTQDYEAVRNKVKCFINAPEQTIVLMNNLTECQSYTFPFDLCCFYGMLSVIVLR